MTAAKKKAYETESSMTTKQQHGHENDTSTRPSTKGKRGGKKRKKGKKKTQQLSLIHI